MKQCASIAHIIKNDSVRKDGFNPLQRVLAKALRRPVALAEEDEWVNLEFWFCSKTPQDRIWFQGQVADEYPQRQLIVWMDRGHPYAAAMLRKAKPSVKE